MLDRRVLQAALIGLPDEELGHRPAAFLVQAAGSDVDADALRAFAARSCNRDLSRMTMTFLESLPMTPTGKISKAQLVDLAMGKADG